MLKFIKENDINFFVIGGGSNILFGDDGFRGIVIKLSLNSTSEFGRIEGFKTGDVEAAPNEIEITAKDSVSNTVSVCCGAAVSLAYLAIKTAEQGLSGLEQISAIPGTIGGAVFGNAGVTNCSVSDVVDKIEVIDYSGNKKVLTKKDIKFEYRKSDLQSNIITKVFFILKKADKNDILKTISQELKRRKSTQPLGTKNAGCVFKNPKDDSAGRLIDSLKLKCYSVGGVEISDVHANFFVNKNNGCAKDMLNLIEFVKDEVYKKYNIKLETEIKIIK